MRYEHEAGIALDLARRAGAMAVAAQAAAVERRKADGSPVCGADQDADAIIGDGLAAHFPADALCSEERRDDGVRLRAKRVWIVDPIDGTRAYLDGRDEWSVHIALWEAGQLVLGLVGLPARERYLLGVCGAGARSYRVTEQVISLPERPASRVLVSRRLHNQGIAERLRAALPGYEMVFSSSVGGKVDLLLAGRAVAYVHPLPLHIWDDAAPCALLRAAGGQVTTLDETPLDFNGVNLRHEQGLLFSVLPQEVHHHLAAQIRAGLETA